MKNLIRKWWFILLILIIYTGIIIGITTIVNQNFNKTIVVSAEESKNYNDVSGTISVEEDNSKEKENYISNSIEVYDVKASYMDSLLDGKVPGLTFKIKNKGDKTLTKLEITFYYKNNNGEIIYDKAYMPIDSTNIYVGTGVEKELKPNYIWQLESDKFYPDKKVPKEWKEGSVEYKVTNIEF